MNIYQGLFLIIWTISAMFLLYKFYQLDKKIRNKFTR
jgi:hypothetical protein